jgi:hypothetical protein
VQRIEGMTIAEKGFNEIFRPEFPKRASYLAVYSLQMAEEKKRLIFSSLEVCRFLCKYSDVVLLQ